jgi:hypothetical protein
MIQEVALRNREQVEVEELWEEEDPSSKLEVVEEDQPKLVFS